jgi:hypothetical protein
MKLKKIVYSLTASTVVSALLTVPVMADVKGASYLLTMSKNDKVCQRLEHIFTWDLIKKGKLALDEHEEFNWLKWDQSYFMIRQKSNLEPNYDDKLISKDGYSEEYASYSKFPKKGAFFDINNDGENEFITFERNDASNTFKSRAYDEIRIHRGNALTKLAKAETIKQLTPEMGYLGGITYDHVLKEYPVAYSEINKNGFVYNSWSSISDSYIRPLLIDNTYYVALFGNTNGPLTDFVNLIYNQTIDEKNAIAIVKFLPSKNMDMAHIHNQFSLLATGKPSNDTQDICYFVKTQLIQQGDK